MVKVLPADVTGELTKWKDFMSDRPAWAVVVILACVCFYLFRKYDSERQAHMRTLRQIVPVTEKLCDMLSRVGALQKKYNTDPRGRSFLGAGDRDGDS